MASGTVGRRIVLSVTIHAISHVQGSHLFYLYHLRHVTVALRTIHTSRNVTRMIKLNMIRHIMNFNPLDRLIIVIRLSKFFDQRCIFCYH